jgi:hypothetical protein
MKSTALLLSVAALSAGLLLSGGTRAEDWKPVGTHAWFGVGKTYEINKGHFYWVGEYSGTFWSDQGEKGLFDHAVECAPVGGQFEILDLTPSVGFPENGNHDETPITQRGIQAPGC